MKAERAICSNAHMDHSDCFEINLLERYPLLFSSYILSFILNMKIVFYESANSTVFSWFFFRVSDRLAIFSTKYFSVQIQIGTFVKKMVTGVQWLLSGSKSGF